MLQLPLGFARVGEGIYRSAYPASKTLPFVKTLQLRSMVCLYPKDIRSDLREYAEQNGIKIIEADIGANQEPFIVMSTAAVSSALAVLSDPASHPVLVFCTSGKVRTGCVIGCLRKLMGWSIVTIVHELEHSTDGEASLADQIFVEQFES